MNFSTCAPLLLWLITSLTGCAKPERQAEPKPAEEPQPQEAVVHPEFFGEGASRCPWRVLKAQGFSETMGQGVTIRFLGTVPARSHRYAIYVHYFANPENNHGHTRVVVMRHHCRYVGHYYVMAEPIRIRGSDIIFNAPKKYGNLITFARGLPPKEAWIDGEIHEFTR